jgi:flagellar motor switch protein FliN
MSAVEEPVSENLQLIYDVPVSLSVELGRCQMPMKNVLQLEEGSIVKLEKKADTPVDLFVNNKRIGQGEVVVVDNQFGIKITKIL